MLTVEDVSPDEIKSVMDDKAVRLKAVEAKEFETLSQNIKNVINKLVKHSMEVRANVPDLVAELLKLNHNVEKDIMFLRTRDANDQRELS